MMDPSRAGVDSLPQDRREWKGTTVELAGVITGTIKFLIGLGIVIGLVIAFLVVKLVGRRRH
jgi:hypothetical protein